MAGIKDTKVAEQVKQAVQNVLNEAVQEAEENFGDMRSGTIVDRGKPTERKVPWTKAALEKAYPMVDLTPDENIPVIVHGVRYNLFQDQPCKVPSIVRDIYLDSKRETRKARHIINEMGPLVNLGVGGSEQEK